MEITLSEKKMTILKEVIKIFQNELGCVVNSKKNDGMEYAISCQQPGDWVSFTVEVTSPCYSKWGMESGLDLRFSLGLWLNRKYEKEFWIKILEEANTFNRDSKYTHCSISPLRDEDDSINTFCFDLHGRYTGPFEKEKFTEYAKIWEKSTKEFIKMINLAIS